MEPLRLAPFPWKLGWQESSFRKPETPNSPRLSPAHEAQNAVAVNPRNWLYPFGKILVEKIVGALSRRRFFSKVPMFTTGLTSDGFSRYSLATPRMA